MNETIEFVARHGYALIFFWLLVEQGGLPVPSTPLLLVSGALARTGQLRLAAIFLYALPACLIADNVWFQLGRRLGGKALRFICRISLEPDSCVRRTENVFVKYGVHSLMVAKFIPGLNAVAAPLSGGSRVGRGRFLLFDTIGAFVWIGTYVLAGYVFSDQLEVALHHASRLGSGFLAIVACSLAAWIVWKSVQRRRYAKQIQTARISAEELRWTLDSGAAVMVVDVRSELASESDGIPGALRIPTEDLPQRHNEIPLDREIVLVCT